MLTGVERPTAEIRALRATSHELVVTPRRVPEVVDAKRSTVGTSVLRAVQALVGVILGRRPAPPPAKVGAEMIPTARGPNTHTAELRDGPTSLR